MIYSDKNEFQNSNGVMNFQGQGQPCHQMSQECENEMLNLKDRKEEDMLDRLQKKLDLKVKVVKKVRELKNLNHCWDRLTVFDGYDPYEPECQEILEEMKPLETELKELLGELKRMDNYKTDNKEELDYVQKDVELFLTNCISGYGRF